MEKSFTERLDKWTISQLQISSRIHKSSGKIMWWTYRGLKSIQHMNLAIATTTNVNIYDELGRPSEDVIRHTLPLYVQTNSIRSPKLHDEYKRFIAILSQPRWKIIPTPYTPRHPLPTHLFERHNGTIHIWTDGSLRKNGIAISATFSGQNRESSTANFTPGIQDVPNAELYAILIALEMLPEHQNVRIFTDSKTAIQMIQNYRSWKKKQISKSPYRLVLERIDKRITNLKQAQTEVKFEHVFAHLLDHNQRTELLEKRYQQMKQIYGNLTDYLLKGNQAADQLTHAEDDIITDPNTHTTDLPSTYLTHHNIPWIRNTRQEILRLLTTQMKDEWFKKTTRRTAILKDDTIDQHNWTRLRTHKIHLGSHSNLSHKIILDTLYTNQKAAETYNELNPWCTRCNRNGQETLEDSNHIFSSCPSAIEINKEMWNELTTKLEPSIHPIPPPWFNTDSHQYDVNLQTYDKGFIPKYIIKHMNKHTKKKKDKKEIKQTIYYMIAKYTPPYRFGHLPWRIARSPIPTRPPVAKEETKDIITLSKPPKNLSPTLKTTTVSHHPHEPHSPHLRNFHTLYSTKSNNVFATYKTTNTHH
ncbi:hypothetical protein PROFUN_11547 [Planoprotostelium fungivorum]|uniref:RNase H type-1 domain-containing protein n=1 Tax=Planoprotostelium fungivorum TaxID=1890364 RepID=A0A2P6N9H9_9EUKA|nr:hypothetical protein PROFUN_11547 [Planoprotostelium fungivorum]